jgi:peptidoglycan/LPS O-acetylase OafA/YrhL
MDKIPMFKAVNFIIINILLYCAMIYTSSVIFNKVDPWLGLISYGLSLYFIVWRFVVGGRNLQDKILSLQDKNDIEKCKNEKDLKE